MKPILCLVSVLVLTGVATSLQAQSPSTGVTVISSNQVAATFAKGGPLLETNQFKIQAGRREAPGTVEIHARDTDIFHVLEGSATFVTGGVAVDPKPLNADEIRAKEIRGGESRRLKKGDIIVIPSGVPHWFKEVDAPLLSYVVKVTAPKTGNQ